MSDPRARIEIFRETLKDGTPGRWYFRRVAGNGQNTGTSQPYSRRYTAIVMAVKRNPDIYRENVVDLTRGRAAGSVQGAAVAAESGGRVSLRYGELFAGYHGLGMGLQSVLGGSTAWFSEFDKAPSAILAHHWPDVPNHGDITKIDFTKVEPVDVLTGGSPCQDLSSAGKRAGMTSGTRSNLWVQMREAIATLRPRLVVWENVSGALSAAATSAVEPCQGCMGGRDGQPALRALGRVVGDLSELRYESWWVGLRASDVGGAHGRFRVFLFALDSDSTSSGAREAIPTSGVPLQHRGVGRPLRRGDARGDSPWGPYRLTRDRWANVLGRPAPSPVDDKGRVSACFQEWLMGLPEGHVTGVPGLTNEEQLKALGNGVVPQQAAAAARWFLAQQIGRTAA